jgi:4-amino-4-deoxy-L-arabinose transferase-like glycosyltransferase
VARRVAPWWFFAPILTVGMLPWLPALPGAVKSAWQARQADTGFRCEAFLLIWVTVIFVFFSLSGSKLPSYILPVFPALALLIGRYLQTAGPGFVRLQIIFVAIIAALVAASSLVVSTLGKAEVPNELYRDYVPWIAAAGLGGLAAAVFAWRHWRNGQLTPALIAVALGSFLTAYLIGHGHDSLNPASSAYRIARQIQPRLEPGIPFYSVGTYPQTLPFYIDRTLTLVAFADELEFGLEQEPKLWMPDYATFEKQWRATPRAFAIMPPRIYAELKQKGLPMQVIARDTRRVVVETVHPSGPAAMGEKSP